MPHNLFDFQEVVKFLQQNGKGEWHFGGVSTQFSEITYDTRLIISPEKTVFWALKTPFRDGQNYIAAAYELGVRNFCCSQPLSWAAVNYYVVENPLLALQIWAQKHRQQFNIPCVAITGSNGKTIVKEWVTELLDDFISITRSPRSYNSQLGVPLSLLQLTETTELGIFEAGISTTGEMSKLTNLIQPTIGVFTHFGNAHQEGFASEKEKLIEKLHLFQPAKLVISWYHPLLDEVLSRGELSKWVFISDLHPTAWRVKTTLEGSQAVIILTFDGRDYPIKTPLTDTASIQNAAIAFVTSFYLLQENGLREKISIEKWLPLAYEKLLKITPVSMRLEIITDNPEITILNDSYNADTDSLWNAISRLRSLPKGSKKMLIVTDFEHLGKESYQKHHELLQQIIRIIPPQNCRFIGKLFFSIAANFSNIVAYETVEQFFKSVQYEDFANSILLIKGARKYELERIIPFFTRRPATSQFCINLSLLKYNYRKIKNYISNDKKIIAMLKAGAYGAGSVEIAQALIPEGLEAISVAYLNEAIQLRLHGIQIPILVLHSDTESLDLLWKYNLQPAVWSFALLERILSYARSFSHKIFIHIEFDTGMGRLGFAESDAPKVLGKLLENQLVVPVGIFSHLAAADTLAEQEFTRSQIACFQRIANIFLVKFPAIQRHLANTAGILAYPEAHFEVVRLGLGLYGVSPFPEVIPLQEIGSLKSKVAQIHKYSAGTSVGYGRSEVLSKASLIATIPIGYADGVPRCLGNGVGYVLIREQKVPIIGRICMDMLMADVTAIAEVQEGDEVVLFGRQGAVYQSVVEMAQQANTIPYEILAGIPTRVQRIYVSE